MGIVTGFRWVLGTYHVAMNELFSSYGSFVAHKPFLPMIIGLLLFGGLSVGLVRRKTETDLEKLWVEHDSRVVDERIFFNERFGGIPRKEFVTISSSSSPDGQLDLKKSMDALTFALNPIYSNLSMEHSVGNSTIILTNTDFCERPFVPTTLKPGTNPLVDKNWGSWGLQFLSTCSIMWAYEFKLNASYALPTGWGIDQLPCNKLTPMDCFKEGGDIDYPDALKELEKPLPDLHNLTGVTLIDLIVGFANLESSPVHCFSVLEANISALMAANNMSNATIPQILNDVDSVMKLAFTWGYRWRKSYSDMNSNAEILDHFNSAIEFGRHKSPNPADAQTVQCVMQKLPCCVAWFGVHIPLLTAFGGVQFDPSGKNITQIEAIRWGANNFHQDHPLFAEYIDQRLGTAVDPTEREALVKDWEEVMINHLRPLWDRAMNSSFAPNDTNADLQLDFGMWRSSEDIIADASKAPVWQLIVSVVLVSIYGFLAFVNFRDPVHSHAMLALTGMGVVAFAVIAGFGLTALCGISFSPLAGSVVPFLALGLGIDDVFVLVTILRNYLEDPQLKGRNGSRVPDVEMRLTVALAGPSVVLTTFSVLASFLISSVNPMPVSQWFCWQMGITAAIHTLGMLLIFVPFMALDARRTKAEVNDPVLWVIFGLHPKRWVKQEEKQSAQAMEEEPFDVSDMIFQENKGSSTLSRWVATYYGPLFESNVFKISVVIVFAAILASMAFLGFHKVSHGLNLSDVTLTGSYQNTFAKITEQKFLSYDLWIVTRDINLPQQQSNIIEIYQAIQNLTEWAPSQPGVFELSFLGNFYLWNNASTGIGWPLPANQTFYDYENIWSSFPLGLVSLPDIYCEDAVSLKPLSCFVDVNAPGYQPNPNFRIGASKAAMFAQNLGAAVGPNLAVMKTTRQTVDGINAKLGTNLAYMYGYTFLFFEQYLHSSHDLYMVVGLALVGVFVAVLIFQFSITISLLIAAVLLMVDLEVYGFIYIIGAKLNSLSLVNLGIVIGMASELTYLARSFLVVDGTRNYRVRKALEWTFEPLLQGFGTQFVATLPLLFLKYHAFRLYYFGMFTIMGVLAFLNGFVLLPVLLSWFGPPPLPHITNKCGGGDEKKGVCPDSNDTGPVSPVHSGKSPMIPPPKAAVV
jgi:patched 2 protein